MQTSLFRSLHNVRIPLVSLLTAFILSNCTGRCSTSRSDLQPEDVVQAYLDVAFNMEAMSEKSDLVEYTTGPLKESLESASDQSIKDAYINRKFDLNRYSMIERRDRTPRETEITFEISYRDLAPQGKDDTLSESEIPTVTTENTVLVVRKRKLWYIYDVLNKKTSFDFPTTVADTHITADPNNPASGEDENEGED